MSKRRNGPWSYTAGVRPCTVTVYEREPGGVIYARAWDPTLRGGEGGAVRRSLKHCDKQKAIEYAGDEAKKLARGYSDLARGRITLKDVFKLYKDYRTPRKSESEQQADERRIELWTRVLGGERDPHEITQREWESFIDRRGSGEIDSRAKATRTPKPVRARSVESDCLWLGWVFNWASRWKTERGYLMRENPIRGFERPKELNPRRPVASQDRYEAVRAVSDQVMMENRWEKKWREERSYLSEILDIAHGTGRRITAICSLTYADLRLSEGPHGSIRWPADTDKMGRETVVPISPGVRGAIDRVLRERPGVGARPIFPSPDDPAKPVRSERASIWLREAEERAGLAKQDGSLWHAYRRGWATARKSMPDVDVAAAGGWKSTGTLRRVYQQPDAKTMLKVVLEAPELREAK